MSNLLQLLLLAALLCAAAAWSRRRDDGRGPLPLLGGFADHLRAAYAGWGAAFALAAVVSTVALVLAGWDRELQDVAQRTNPLGRVVPRALLRGGHWWTAAVAAALALASWWRPRGGLRLAAAAAVQAVLGGLLVTLALKMLTGRLGPANPEHARLISFPKTEDAGAFAFDFWARVPDDGRFFWPSGHTLSSAVLVTALAAAFPERRWIAWLGWPLVAFMALAMVDGDFHWASDVLAAVLLALPLGRTVGTGLRRRVRAA